MTLDISRLREGEGMWYELQLFNRHVFFFVQVDMIAVFAVLL